MRPAWCSLQLPDGASAWPAGPASPLALQSWSAWQMRLEKSAWEGVRQLFLTIELPWHPTLLLGNFWEFAKQHILTTRLARPPASPLDSPPASPPWPAGPASPPAAPPCPAGGAQPPALQPWPAGPAAPALPGLI